MKQKIFLFIFLSNLLLCTHTKIWCAGGAALVAQADPANDCIIGFIDAIENENLDDIRSYVSTGVNPDTPLDDTGTTALMKACEKGNIELVTLLLQFNANPNTQDAQRRKVIYFADVCFLNPQTRVTGLKILIKLIEAGINLNDITPIKLPINT